MTCKLTGTMYTGATMLDEACNVRCACGLEFVKSRISVLQIRAKGFHLRCWKCKRKAQSEFASAQAAARGGWAC